MSIEQREKITRDRQQQQGSSSKNAHAGHHKELKRRKNLVFYKWRKDQLLKLEIM
jgi:hypothetical protein